MRFCLALSRPAKGANGALPDPLAGFTVNEQKGTRGKGKKDNRKGKRNVRGVSCNNPYGKILTKDLTSNNRVQSSNNCTTN